MDSLKSVLFILPATAVGGAETKFLNILKRMTDFRGILLTNRSVAGYFSIPGLQAYLFEDYGCNGPMPVTLKKARNYACAIKDVVKEEKADCVIGIMHTGSFYASLAKDIFRLKVPLIGTIEGNISAYFRSERRKPSVLEKILVLYLLNRPDLLIVPSEGVKDDLMRNFGMPGGRIRLIYNGIDVDGIREMAAEGLTAGRYHGKTIVTSCRLNAQKDFPTLLRAFAEVKAKMDARLVIVGEGELRDEIIRHCQSLGIEKSVEITGFQENPFGFLRTADVFVLSSFFEGFGNVLLEAMALGVPVVATDCPSGPGEIIRDGVNGLLVPVQDHHAMAGAILRILENAEAGAEFKIRGRETAECFKSEAMIERFRRHISEVC